MSFDASGPGKESSIDPAEIQSKTFSSAWKGYRIEEVRAYLAHVASIVGALLSDLEGVQAKLDTKSRQAGQITDAVEERTREAEKEAAQILHEASEASKALMEKARTYYDSARKRGEEEALELVARSREQAMAFSASGPEAQAGGQFEELAKKELEQARVKAAEILDRSKAEGRAMIDQARDLRNEILADLRQKRSILEIEIADLATRRIEAYQSLSRAVELISEAGTIIGADESEPDERWDEPDTSERSIAAGVSELYSVARDEDSGIGRQRAGDRAGHGEAVSQEAADGYQPKLDTSKVEIGGHLEEGIVRVFYKDSEPGTEPQDQIASYLEREPTESIVQDSNTVESDSAPMQADPTDRAEEDFELSGLLDGGIERELGVEAVADEESGNDGGRGESDAPQVSRVADPEHVNQTQPKVDLSAPPEGRVIGHDAAPETREVAPVNSVSGDLTGHAHLGGVAELERSRKADEVLSRIRSLRMGIIAADEVIRFGSKHRAAEGRSGSSTEERAETEDSIGFADVDLQLESGEKGEFPGSNEFDDGAGTEEASQLDAGSLELLDAREEILAPNAAMLFKRVKRMLADEQNDLLDKVRRTSGSQVVLEDLLDEKEQIDQLALASLDFFEQVRLGVVELFSESDGVPVKREISEHAVECSEEFAKEVVTSMRRRIEDAILLDSTAEDQSTVAAIGSIYRDIRSNRLEQLIMQYVNTVFCATVLHESGYETFLWVTDPEDVPCADCLDNSLAGVTNRGESFPTGHYHPGIHSGCRCLLVPFIA